MTNTRRFILLALGALLPALVLPACGDDEEPAGGGGDATADTTADGDTAGDADAVEDAAPDAVEDAVPDAEPDATPDATEDAEPDGGEDTLPDGEEEVLEDADFGPWDVALDEDAGELGDASGECFVAHPHVRVTPHSGEDAVPHVAMAPDGSAWVSWYYGVEGGYRVHLQRLTADGDPVFNTEGLRVSDEPSQGWVMDYSLVAADGDAVVVFCDARSGEADFDAVAYRIDSEGNHVWSEDGITLSTTEPGDATPKAVLTTEGAIVAAWERWPTEGDSEVVLQRIAADGTLEWGDGVVIPGGEGLDAVRPWIVPSDDDQVIVIWIVTPGGMSNERTILARLVDAAGEAVWDEDAVVSVDMPMPFYTDPVIAPDDSGGAYVAWVGLADMDLKAYVQHVGGDGQLRMDEDGVPVSSDAAANQVSPLIAGGPDGVGVVWQDMDRAQTEWGVSAQWFDPEGVPQWEAPELELWPRTPEGSGNVGISGAAGGFVALVDDRTPSGGMADDLLAAWLPLEESPVSASRVVSAYRSAKLHFDISGSNACGRWVVWEDMRRGVSDVQAAFLPFLD